MRVFLTYQFAGVLLPELVKSLVLLQLNSPTILHVAGIVPMLMVLLDIIDKFNKLAPGLAKEDSEDLAWPGVWGMLKKTCDSCIESLYHYLFFTETCQEFVFYKPHQCYASVAGSLEKSSSKAGEDVAVIRKADLENHNKDGGLWITIHGKVHAPIS